MAHMDYSKNPPVLVDEWHIEDIQSQHPWVTDTQAVEVLKRLAKYHDCEIGITWEGIAITVDNMFPKPDEWELKPFAVYWADIKADCQYDHDNEGYIYGIHWEDEDGQVVDAEWFKLEADQLKVIADYEALMA